MATTTVTDVVRLSSRLREEHLYVQTEQRNLQTIFHEILSETERLHRCAWITWQHKLLGDQLVVPNLFNFSSLNPNANNNDATPTVNHHAASASLPRSVSGQLQRHQHQQPNPRRFSGAADESQQLTSKREKSLETKPTLCRRYYCTENCNAVQAATVFHGRLSLYSEIVTLLRREPEHLAEFIFREFDNTTASSNVSTVSGTDASLSSSSSYNAAVFHAIYTVLGPLHGFLTFPDDQSLSFDFVRKLMQLQFSNNATTKCPPLRVMKHTYMPFTCAFKMLAEHLHEAKVYLITALRTALLEVVADDSFYWEVEPHKLLHHFTVDEQRARFGPEGSEQFCERVAHYQHLAVNNLVRITRAVIEGIVQSLYCFPPNLAWLFNEIHTHLTETFQSHPNLPTIFCTESLFTHFICSAIVNPETFASLSNDIFISRIARFNLSQIAQILQTLAMSKWESVTPQSRTIMSNFEPEEVWRILDFILEIGRSASASRHTNNRRGSATTTTSISNNNNLLSLPTDGTTTMTNDNAAAAAAVLLNDDESTNSISDPKRATIFVSHAELEVLIHMARLIASQSSRSSSSNLNSYRSGGGNLHRGSGGRIKSSSHTGVNNKINAAQKFADKLYELIRRIPFNNNQHTSITQLQFINSSKNSKVPPSSAANNSSGIDSATNSGGSTMLTNLRDEINHIMLCEQTKDAVLSDNINNGTNSPLIIMPLSDAPLPHEQYPGSLSEADVVNFALASKRRNSSKASDLLSQTSEFGSVSTAALKMAGGGMGRKASLSSLGKASSTASSTTAHSKTIDEQDDSIIDDEEARSAFSAYSYQSSMPESAADHQSQQHHLQQQQQEEQQQQQQQQQDRDMTSSSHYGTDTLSAVSEEYSNVSGQTFNALVINGAANSKKETAAAADASFSANKIGGVSSTIATVLDGAVNVTRVPVVSSEDVAGGIGGGTGGGRHSRGGSSMEMNAEDVDDAAASIAGVMDDADVIDAINVNDSTGDHHHQYHHHHNNHHRRRHHHRRQGGGGGNGAENGGAGVDEDDDLNDVDDVVVNHLHSHHHHNNHHHHNDEGGGARSDVQDDMMSEIYYANSVLSGRASLSETQDDVENDADNDADDDDDDDVEDARMLSPSANTAIATNTIINAAAAALVADVMSRPPAVVNTEKSSAAGGDAPAAVAAVDAVNQHDDVLQTTDVSSVPEKFATFAEVKQNVAAAAAAATAATVGHRDFDARSDAAWSTEVAASDTDETAGGGEGGGGNSTPSTSKHRKHFRKSTGDNDKTEPGASRGTADHSTSSSTSSLAVIVGDAEPPLTTSAMTANAVVIQSQRAVLSSLQQNTVAAPVSSSSVASTSATPVSKSGGGEGGGASGSSSGGAASSTTVADDIDSDRWSTGVCLSDTERAGLDDSMADLSLAEMDAANNRADTPLDTAMAGFSGASSSTAITATASSSIIDDFGLYGGGEVDNGLEFAVDAINLSPSTPPPFSNVQEATTTSTHAIVTEERDPFLPYNITTSAAPNAAPSTPTPQQQQQHQQQHQQPVPILSRHSKHAKALTAFASDTALASALNTHNNLVQRIEQQEQQSVVANSEHVKNVIMSMSAENTTNTMLATTPRSNNTVAAYHHHQAANLAATGISSPAKSVSFAHEPLFHHYHQQEEIAYNQINNNNSTPDTSNKTFVDETTITRTTQQQQQQHHQQQPLTQNYEQQQQQRPGHGRPMDLDGDSEVIGRSPPKRTRRLPEFTKIFTQTKLRLKNSNTIASALGRAGGGGGRLSEPVMLTAPQSADVLLQRPSLLTNKSQFNNNNAVNDVLQQQQQRNRSESTDDILTKYRSTTPTTTTTAMMMNASITLASPLAESAAEFGGAAADANLSIATTVADGDFSAVHMMDGEEKLHVAAVAASGGQNLAATLDAGLLFGGAASGRAIPFELLFEAAKRKLRAAMNSIDVQRSLNLSFDHPIMPLFYQHDSKRRRSPVPPSAAAANHNHNVMLFSSNTNLFSLRQNSLASSNNLSDDNYSVSSSSMGTTTGNEHALITFLRLQLAECSANGERQQVALLRATLRIIRFLLEAAALRSAANSSIKVAAANLLLADTDVVSSNPNGPVIPIDIADETVTPVSILNDEHSVDNILQTLLSSLQTDFAARESYIAYLVRCRQGLLRSRQQLQSLLKRYNCDAHAYSNRFVAFIIQNFLFGPPHQQNEQQVVKFVMQFQHTHVADEKIDMLEKFLVKLQAMLDSQLSLDAAAVIDNNNNSSSSLRAELYAALERHLMSRVYYDALFPNGEPDRERDAILHRHIEKLKTYVTADHRDLAIKQVFRLDMPCVSAQLELAALGAFKTPRDKAQCVLRCCLALMQLLQSALEGAATLLSLTSSSSSASVHSGVAAENGGGNSYHISAAVAADDFVPALVFTVLQANPPNLLSTIQYVNAFYGDKHFHGEEAYYWTQFCSAVEFIKTMG